eukprot:872344-Amphidinium_carterae.1
MFGNACKLVHTTISPCNCLSSGYEFAYYSVQPPATKVSTCYRHGEVHPKRLRSTVSGEG